MTTDTEYAVTRRQNLLKHEVHHFIRRDILASSSAVDFTGRHDPVRCAPWRELGERQAKHGDKMHTNNLWRNFNANLGPLDEPRVDYTVDRLTKNVRLRSLVGTPTEQSKAVRRSRAKEVVAAFYPVRIPQYSRLGQEHSFSNYLLGSDLLAKADRKTKRLLLERIKREEQAMTQAHLLTELRNPPIDESGYLLPPAQFKRYRQFFNPTKALLRYEQLAAEEKFALQYGLSKDSCAAFEPDVFGRLIQKTEQYPRLWKLTNASPPLCPPETSYSSELHSNAKSNHVQL